MRRSLHQSSGRKVCFGCSGFSLQHHVGVVPDSVLITVDNRAVYTLLAALDGHICMADQENLTRDFRSNLELLSYNAHSKRFSNLHTL